MIISQATAIGFVLKAWTRSIIFCQSDLQEINTKKTPIFCCLNHRDFKRNMK